MNESFGYSLAFASGIFGAFHCLGMCSGINAGFFTHYGRFPSLFPLLAFHATRVAVYTLFGVSGALLGQVVVLTGIVGKAQGIVMILAGVLVTTIGLNLLGLFSNYQQAKPEFRSVQFVAPPSNIKQRLPTVLAGLLNGLVPCSLVFSVAVKAAATADPLRAGLTMLAFGAGTLPAMGAVSLLGSFLGSRAHNAFVKVAGITVVLLGLWTIYEGFTFYDIMRGLANW